MDLTADEFDDLVGAYALDACEPDEVEAMERYVAANRDAADENCRKQQGALPLHGESFPNRVDQPGRPAPRPRRRRPRG